MTNFFDLNELQQYPALNTFLTATSNLEELAKGLDSGYTLTLTDTRRPHRLALSSIVAIMGLVTHLDVLIQLKQEGKLLLAFKAAVRNGQLGVISYLLEKSSVNTPWMNSTEIRDAVNVASKYEHWAVVKRLLTTLASWGPIDYDQFPLLKEKRSSDPSLFESKPGDFVADLLKNITDPLELYKKFVERALYFRNLITKRENLIKYANLAAETRQLACSINQEIPPFKDPAADMDDFNDVVIAAIEEMNVSLNEPERYSRAQATILQVAACSAYYAAHYERETTQLFTMAGKAYLDVANTILSDNFDASLAVSAAQVADKAYEMQKKEEEYHSTYSSLYSLSGIKQVSLKRTEEIVHAPTHQLSMEEAATLASLSDRALPETSPAQIRLNSLRTLLMDNSIELPGRVVDVLGDGNCFFHAVAREMNRLLPQQVTHLDLRAGAVEYLRSHPELFNDFLAENETAETYLRKMSDAGAANGERSGTWVDGRAIQALARQFNIQLYLFRLENTQDGVAQFPMYFNDDDSARVTIGVLQYDDYRYAPHYLALELSNEPQLKMSPDSQKLNTSSREMSEQMESKLRTFTEAHHGLNNLAKTRERSKVWANLLVETLELANSVNNKILPFKDYTGDFDDALTDAVKEKKASLNEPERYSRAKATILQIAACSARCAADCEREANRLCVETSKAYLDAANAIRLGTFDESLEAMIAQLSSDACKARHMAECHFKSCMRIREIGLAAHASPKKTEEIAPAATQQFKWNFLTKEEQEFFHAGAWGTVDDAYAYAVSMREQFTPITTNQAASLSKKEKTELQYVLPMLTQFKINFDTWKDLKLKLHRSQKDILSKSNKNAINDCVILLLLNKLDFCQVEVYDANLTLRVKHLTMLLIEGKINLEFAAKFAIDSNVAKAFASLTLNDVELIKLYDWSKLTGISFDRFPEHMTVEEILALSEVSKESVVSEGENKQIQGVAQHIGKGIFAQPQPAGTSPIISKDSDFSLKG